VPVTRDADGSAWDGNAIAACILSEMGALVAEYRIAGIAIANQRTTCLVSNLAAALLRPQIALLPVRDPREAFVPSSIQFSMGLPSAQMQIFVNECALLGQCVKWFGLPKPIAFTSNYGHWHYLAEQAPMPRSMAVLRQARPKFSASFALLGRSERVTRVAH
jgi:hypothetical protein